MRSLFLWHSSSPVDLDPLAERDGVRWCWRTVADDRIVQVRERVAPVPVQPIGVSPPSLSISMRLFTFRSTPFGRFGRAGLGFVEEGLSTEEALAAWEKGGQR